MLPILIAAPLLLAQAAPGACVPGAHVEVQLQKRWWPAVVRDGLRPDGTCRVTHKAYAGIENDQDVPLAAVRTATGVGPAGEPASSASGPAAPPAAVGALARADKPGGRSAPAAPPTGRYNCMNAGSSVGVLQFGGGRYSIAGVSGAYRYEPASRRLVWQGGAFAKWGWSGEWRTDAVFTRGPAEPRIELTDGRSLHVHCYAPKS